jgi:hypothetical protein
VLRGGAAAHSDAGAHHQRHARLPVEHVADLRRLVHDFVGRTHREIGEAQFDHGTGTRNRCADARRHDHRLRDRRIDDAVRSELRLQPLVLTGEAALGPEVFAQRPHPWVAIHLLLHSKLGGFRESEFHCHRGAPMSCTSV